MDKVVLALVHREMPILDAMGKFLPRTQALVVSGFQDVAQDPRHGARLVTAADITATINGAVEAQQNIAKVQVGAAVPQHRPVSTTGYALPSVADEDALSPIEEKGFAPVFASADDRYVIADLRPSTAVVITASERFALQLSGFLILCSCAGQPVHTFVPSQLRDPKKCNYLHGKPVTCRQVGGGP